MNKNNNTSRFLKLTLGVMLIALLFSQQPSGVAHAANFTAGTFAELVAAINTANSNGTTDDITLTADITLANVLPDLTSDITINGAGFMLNGNNSVRVLHVSSGGIVTLNDITITNGNVGDVAGGILIKSATLTLNNSTVSNNTASNFGGGLYCHDGCNLTINNSTISGNRADIAGGGITDANGINTININNSTISGNTAPVGVGGGIDAWGSGSTWNITNTIIANSNTTAVDCDRTDATVNSLGYNLVEAPGDCNFAATGDITGQDPLLDPLADNGGATQTHFPQKFSPILDAGSCTGGLDQRGLPRPVDLTLSGLYPNVDNGCDIGAVEAQGEMPTAVSLQSISANSNAALLPILIATLLLLLAGGVVQRRRSAS